MVRVLIFTQSLFACRSYELIIVYKVTLAAGFIEDMQNIERSVENNIAVSLTRMFVVYMEKKE